MRLDLLHLLRNLRHSPVSAAAAVLTLTLTFGAGISIFAVVDAVLLTPPPFADPDTLVIAGERPADDATGALRAIAYARFMDWRMRAASLATLEAFDGTNLTLTGRGAAQRITATDVTTGLPALLGVVPARGRVFTADDSGRLVVLVSDAFWQGRLDADPYVIGRQIVLGGQPHTIVGVLPERFDFAFGQSDVWRPLPAPADAVRAGSRVQVVARLARSVTLLALTDSLDEVSRTSTTPMRAVTTPVAMAIAGEATRLLGLLGGGALIAVLIAFTNLAGLLIVRAIDRRRELSLRQALGAPRIEIAKQLLLEAETLVMAGAIGGLLVAWWITPAVGRLVLQQFGDRANRTMTVSWPVIALIIAVAAFAACLCALIPAMLTTRRLETDIRRRGVMQTPHERLLRRVFVTGVVSCGFVLLVSLALLGRSLIATLQTHPGFDADNVSTMQVSLPAAAYPGIEQVVSFYARLQSELDRRLASTAIANELPLTGDRGRAVVSVRPAQGLEAIVREVGTRYFDVMRIRLIAGRSFDSRDNLSAPPRAVVSQSLARRLFGSHSPIGRQLSMAPATQPIEIVGVVGDVKHRGLDDPPFPTLYLSAWQTDSRNRLIAVRDLRAQADVVAIVRDVVARSDRNLPVYRVRSMRDIVDASPGVPARRVLTAAFAGFALLAVVLGAIGVFGIVAHDVAARRLELALRLALGAPPGHLFGDTLRQGAIMVGAGLIVGGVIAAWVAPALGAMGATSGHLDPLSLVAGAMVLVVTGLGAVLPVARRAARTDPLTLVRSE